MRNLLKAAILSFKISFMLILAFWLLLAMGIELFPWSFFGLSGYMAMFFFVGYNCYLWYVAKDDSKEVKSSA